MLLTALITVLLLRVYVAVALVIVKEFCRTISVTSMEEVFSASVNVRERVAALRLSSKPTSDGSVVSGTTDLA